MSKNVVVSDKVWKHLFQQKLDTGADNLNEVIAKQFGINDEEVISE